MRRQRIVARARGLLDTPFVHLGRQPGAGLDCVGVLVVCYRAAGIILDDSTIYTMTPPDGQIDKELRRQKFDLVDEPDTGDVVTLRIRGKILRHAGIFTGDSVIHAIRGRGVVEWRAGVRNILGAYQHRYMDVV